ncbi:MAG: hypothetical protein AB7F86_16435 [Bdellovibrionales bacterium]
MHRLNLLIFVIGIIWSGLAYAEDEDAEDLAEKKGLVIVEPLNVITTEEKGEYRLLPYPERRSKWGFMASLGYSSYEPLNYEPAYAPAGTSFYEVYGGADMPLIELAFTIKRNLAMGAIGLEIGAGMTQNATADKDYGDSFLRIIPIKVMLNYYLDTMGKEPVLAPYIGGGAYVMQFREELDSEASNGSTQAAPYIHAGIAFQLDWIDRAAATISYRESGIQSSFIYVEAQSYMISSAQSDEDFSSFSYAGGMKLEF